MRNYKGRKDVSATIAIISFAMMLCLIGVAMVNNARAKEIEAVEMPVEESPIVIVVDKIEDEEVVEEDVKIDCSEAEELTEVELPKPMSRYHINISEEAIDLMARIVYLEARGESYEGQQAVAEVILNRVIDERYPDTVEGVINDTKYGVQFVTARYAHTAKPDETQFSAVRNAIDGEYILDTDVIYFSTKPQNSRIAAVIGGHYFCR